MGNNGSRSTTRQSPKKTVDRVAPRGHALSPSKGRGPGSRRAKEHRTLALASGGVAGLLYQVGVLEALEDVADGFDARSFDSYIGVGSGAVIAALLANGIPPREIALAFEGTSSRLPPFHVSRLLRPNCRELLAKGVAAPRAIWGALQESLETPSEISWQDTLLSLTGLLPSGLYLTGYLEEYLRDALGSHGLTDDFDALAKELYVVASDVDTGQSAVFARGDGRDVSISRAVAATAALPMLFAPVEIDGRHYVDGTTNKMLHLSLPLDRGATFIFCITPIRPWQGGNGVGPEEHIADGGVVSVAKQALRTLLHSRLAAGLEQYADRPEAVDILLVEPSAEQAGALFFNVSKSRTRALLKEAGYVRGRAELALMAEAFVRHGVHLDVRDVGAASGPPDRLGKSLDRLEDRMRRRRAGRRTRRPPLARQTGR